MCIAIVNLNGTSYIYPDKIQCHPQTSIDDVEVIQKRVNKPREEKPKTWKFESSSGGGIYEVRMTPNGLKCNCFGAIRSKQNCKHIKQLKGFFHRDIIYNTSIQIKHCKPIPLSEGWLFNFGFDKLENDIPTYFKCFGNLIEDDYEYSFNIYVDSEQNYFITVFGRKIIIKHVHQLQNLYHALTEEELTIKDEVY
jgi:hypothetical protein